MIKEESRFATSTVFEGMTSIRALLDNLKDGVKNARKIANVWSVIGTGNGIEIIAETAMTISSLAKQMINNADVILRTEKLVAEGKLHDSAIEKLVR